MHSLQFSGNYLTTFINEILEIQKIDSKKIEIEQINFNLKVLAENLKNSLKELASANKNDFIFEIDPNIPDNLIGDPTKLSQIFINLINNALKFTKNGTVKLIIKLISIENKKVCIYFEVKDNGIGIPKDKFEAVFNSFSQGSIGINRKYKLRGIQMSSPDIRAGVALLIAALSAEGTSIISNIHQIDRGYQNIDGRLNALGASIKRL